MALEKQLLTVPLQHGESSEVDRKLLPQGMFTTIENLRFDAFGRLVKRYGYTTPSKNLTYPAITASTASGAVTRIGSVGGDNVVAYGDNLYSHLAAYDGLSGRGHIPACSYPERDVIQREPNTGAKNPSVAYLNGYTCYVWVEPQDQSVTSSSVLTWGDIRARIYDESTGAVIEESTLYIATGGVYGRSPRVVAADGRFVIVYDKINIPGLSSQTVYALSHPVAYPQSASWGSATSIYSGTPKRWDVGSNGAGWHIIWDTGSAIDVELRSGTAVSTVTASTSNAITSTFSRMFVRSGLGWVAFHDGTDVKWFTFNVSTCVVSSVWTAILSETFDAVALVPISSTEEVLWCGRQYAGATWVKSHHSISRIVAIDSSGTAGSDYTHYGLRPVTHSGFQGDDLLQYAVGVYPSDEGQASLYIVRLRYAGLDQYIPTPEAMLSRGACATQGLFLGECPVVSLGGDNYTEYRFAESEDFRVAELTTNSYVGMPGVSSWKFNFGDPRKNTMTEADGSLYFPGGMVSQYDGKQIIEVGYCSAPELDVNAASSGTGSLTTGAVYQYTATYEWIDARGKRHVSAPALPQQVTATSTMIVDIEVTTLPLTLKGGSADGEVEIHIWRTDADGSVFKRLTTGSNSILVSTPTAFSVTMSDDGTVPTAEVLYTTAGILPAAQPVSARHLAYHGNRLWAADGQTLHYSRFRSGSEALQWADTQEVVGDIEVHVLGSIDAALVALGERSVYLVHGDGPTDRGDNGSYSDPNRIPTEVGTTEPRSVLAWSGGLLFQGARGIYNLPRGGGTPEWIGSKVRDATDGETCVGVALVPDQDHVRFTFSTFVLCMDTRTREWVRYVYYRPPEGGSASPYTLAGCGLWGSTWAVSNSDNVLLESELYSDNGDVITSTFTTGDVRPAGAQGYIRLWQVAVLMKDASQTNVSISAVFDSQGSAVTGSSSLATSSGGAQTELMWQPSRQQCEAFRVTVSDTPGSVAAGVEYNALTFVVGVQRGANRLPATRRRS